MFAENVPMKKGSGFKIESISWLERIPRAIGTVMALILSIIVGLKRGTYLSWDLAKF